MVRPVRWVVHDNCGDGKKQEDAVGNLACTRLTGKGRIGRHKKSVNYSQFEDSDSDGKLLQGTFSILFSAVPHTQIALDDKLYQRDLEVALALSVKELPTVTTDAEEAQDKSIEKCDSRGSETMSKAPHISNCSVASDYLDLDKITEEDDFPGVQGKRKAASKAMVQQRKILLEGSDGDSANDSEPDFATGEESEDDSDFSESEDNDEDFTVRKNKVKEIKKKEVKVKSPVEKKEKKPKSKCNTLVTSGDSAPASVKSELQPSPKKVSGSSEVTRKPLQIRSPLAENKKPKWVPPAMSGSSSIRSPLAGVSVKSPNQSLRLGLSRLARVKPLHPNAASS
ncbi:RAD51-associated protein 1 [Puma concolor]|uniref:RAD51-associated protein 1 n=1 Tax=Puma concolor TaxID=9696 RepID=A0A6P6IEY1_PUMCO|nr:RAD51-associated protein 1 [Puma concolor]